jgi:hypothetical protein
MDEPECANEIREVMESHRIGTQLVEQLWPRMNCVMVYDVDRHQLLTLDQLEIGRSYELIVSTLSGLYRYQTQKTLLVVGRYHDTPTVIIDKA